MKQVLILLPLFSTALLLRAADPAPEIVEARKRYEAAVEAATSPVRNRYIQELQQLKSRAMSMKNLELAVALDQEIKNVSTGVANSALGLESRLAGTSWLWNKPDTRLPNVNSNRITFEKGGASSTTLTWKATEPNTIEYAFENHGNHGTIMFDANLTHGRIHEIQTDGKVLDMPINRAKD